MLLCLDRVLECRCLIRESARCALESWLITPWFPLLSRCTLSLRWFRTLV